MDAEKSDSKRSRLRVAKRGPVLAIFLAEYALQEYWIPTAGPLQLLQHAAANNLLQEGVK